MRFTTEGYSEGVQIRLCYQETFAKPTVIPA